MKRKEFIEKIDKVIAGNEDIGYSTYFYTCDAISTTISDVGSLYYTKEFALLDRDCWVTGFASYYSSNRTDYYCLRAICLEWFKIWSLEEKHYLEY